MKRIIPQYFTTDGTDPRVGWAATVPPTAQTYTAPVPLPASRHAKSRILIDTTWSAVNEAWFSVASEPASASNLAVSKIHCHPNDPSPAEIAAGFANQDDFEYLELMNIGPHPDDLVGLSFAAGLDFTLTEASPFREIPPGSRVLLVRNTSAMAYRHGAGLPVASVFAGSSGPSNSGESLLLLAAMERSFAVLVMTMIPPGRPPPMVPAPSLVLVRPESNPNHARPENWRLSEDAGGTPTGDNRKGYPEWRTAHFSAAEAANPAISGPDADPESDGLANGFEYAVGTDPRAADGSARLPVFTPADFDPGTGPVPYGWLSLRVVRAAEDVTITAQSGADLVTWSAEPSGMVRVGVFDGGDGTAQILWRTATPIGQPDRLFMRVRTSMP